MSGTPLINICGAQEILGITLERILEIETPVVGGTVGKNIIGYTLSKSTPPTPNLSISFYNELGISQTGASDNSTIAKKTNQFPGTAPLTATGTGNQNDLSAVYIAIRASIPNINTIANVAIIGGFANDPGNGNCTGGQVNQVWNGNMPYWFIPYKDSNGNNAMRRQGKVFLPFAGGELIKNGKVNFDPRLVNLLGYKKGAQTAQTFAFYFNAGVALRYLAGNPTGKTAGPDRFFPCDHLIGIEMLSFSRKFLGITTDPKYGSTLTGTLRSPPPGYFYIYLNRSNVSASQISISVYNESGISEQFRMFPQMGNATPGPYFQNAYYFGIRSPNMNTQTYISIGFAQNGGFCSSNSSHNYLDDGYFNGINPQFVVDFQSAVGTAERLPILSPLLDLTSPTQFSKTDINKVSISPGALKGITPEQPFLGGTCYFKFFQRLDEISDGEIKTPIPAIVGGMDPNSIPPSSPPSPTPPKSPKKSNEHIYIISGVVCFVILMLIACAAVVGIIEHKRSK